MRWAVLESLSAAGGRMYEVGGEVHRFPRQKAPTLASTPLSGFWTFSLKTPLKSPIFYEGFPFLMPFCTLFLNLS